MAILPLITYGYASHGDFLVAEQCVVKGRVGGSESFHYTCMCGIYVCDQLGIY